MEPSYWITLGLGIATILGTAATILFGTDLTSKKKERRQKFEDRINSFHRPILQAFTTSKMLRDVLVKDKPKGFRTLPYLIENRSEITDSEWRIIHEIVSVGEQIEQLITENSGKIVDKNLREEVAILARHLRIFRLVVRSEAEFDSDQFKEFVYPREVNDMVEYEYKVITEMLKSEIDQKHFSRIKVDFNSSKCSMCSQIRGDRDNDLIHKLIGAPDFSYQKTLFFETQDFVTIPSIGPLEVGHILLTPKRHVRSISELSGDEINKFLEYKAEISKSLNAMFEKSIHFFEHGNSSITPRIICSTEHAHLHAIPSGIDDFIEVSNAKTLNWENIEMDYSQVKSLTKGKEYLYYENPKGRKYLFVSNDVESQFFRKVVAHMQGTDKTWNWRDYPKIQNLEETIRTIKSHEQSNSLSI